MASSIAAQNMYQLIKAAYSGRTSEKALALMDFAGRMNIYGQEVAVERYLQYKGNQLQAAESLGMHRNCLNRYLHRWCFAHDVAVVRAA